MYKSNREAFISIGSRLNDAIAENASGGANGNSKIISGETNNIDNKNDNNGNNNENAGNIESNEPQKKKAIMPQRNPEAIPETLPEKLEIKWDVIKGDKIISDYSRDYNISFPDSGEYSVLPGITCFRGNNYRNSASYGYADIKEEKLEEIWSFSNGSIDVWTGVGWTGQPAIIMWDEQTKNIMNIFPSKKQKEGLKEVIYATLDGKIYFFDLEDGKPTREPINIGYPIKGTVTVDPRGYPLLYTGQGIPEKNGEPGPIGFRIFSLINHKMLYYIDGYDKHAFRRWGAFDSSGVIDTKTDTLIEAGENGIIYTVKLNTKYDPDKGTISVNPDLEKYRYKSAISKRLGVENSPVIFKNYVYFIDNSGLLQCVDLNTLKPVWARNVTDDTDSTIVLEVESETEVSLYTACEVDLQGSEGYSYIRKIDAFTGRLIWEKAVKCEYNPNNNGGALASPVIGKNDIDNFVIYNIAKTGKIKKQGMTVYSGKLFALDKNSGKEVWTVELENDSWSSPVDVYTKDGKSYLIQCDSVGNVYLIEGKSGKILDTINLGANIEASPAVYDNILVIGTRGQKICGIRIK
ncbi:MAG TPA: PQQ-like beta-propeller repeat protein [Clostridiaceae bacterium]|nr:PQQ-like beta-propeller repeat protein [Clostridiaceae bacterium]